MLEPLQVGGFITRIVRKGNKAPAGAAFRLHFAFIFCGRVTTISPSQINQINAIAMHDYGNV